MSYKEKRDFPSEDITSKLSPYIHFGEISIHTIYTSCHTLLKNTEHPETIASITTFMKQIAWREFSYYLIYHEPSTIKENYNKNFDNFLWENNEQFLEIWKNGETGFDLVDAGMKELITTGFMHNRVRMITASFLTKNLLIDWRIGASWFMENLLDADIANNTMGWQWIAGSGIDSAPYFRIFNPELQEEKFDPLHHYIKKWNPKPQKNKMISLQESRKKALAIYQKTKTL